MRKSQTFIIRVLFILCLALFPSIMVGQDLQVKEPLHESPFDIITSDMAVMDYNNVPCALVKVQLPIPGATFQGNIFKSEFKTNEYWLWMTNGTKKFRIRCPGFQTMEVDVTKTVPEGLKSNICYAIMLVAPTNSGTTNADDGMRYLIINVNPANASVAVDDKPRPVQDGSANVLLPKGTHTYRVEALGFSSKTGTVELGDEKMVVDVSLESSLAQVTVSCPTTGAQIYVNDKLRGTAPWSGELFEGSYQIEARLEGYRPQRQSITLAESDNRTIDLPALVAITGNLNVNYQPNNSEVWIDGKKAGTSPDIIRNIVIGSHEVEVRANGYRAMSQTVEIREGETAQISGKLTEIAAGSGFLIPDAVDLGLSVKWASFNLGASKPEENGEYFVWGGTRPALGSGSDDKYKWAFIPYVDSGYLNKISKYCNHPYGYNIVDSLSVLQPEDDAATANLGGSWRMPTADEAKELVSKCSHEWTTLNGVNGIKVTGPNGNSIFLPASGYQDHYHTYSSEGTFGIYWTASINPEDDYTAIDFYFHVDNGDKMGLSGKHDSSPRYMNYPVRPVLAE